MLTVPGRRRDDQRRTQALLQLERRAGRGVGVLHEGAGIAPDSGAVHGDETCGYHALVALLFSHWPAHGWNWSSCG